MSKIFKWSFGTVLIGLLVIMGILFFHNYKCNCDFFKGNVFDILSFAFLGAMAFWVSKFTSKLTKKISHVDMLLTDIQNTISELKYCDGRTEEGMKCIRLSQRKIRNKTNVIKSYSQTLNFKKCFEALYEHVMDYIQYCGEHIGDTDQPLSVAELQRHFDLIDKDCDETRLKIYNI